MSFLPISAFSTSSIIFDSTTRSASESSATVVARVVALSATSVTDSAIASMLSRICSMDEACSLASVFRTPAVSWEIFESESRRWATSLIFLIAPRILATRPCIDSFMTAISSLPSALTSTVKSPSLMLLIFPVSSVTGFLIILPSTVTNNTIITISITMPTATTVFTIEYTL